MIEIRMILRLNNNCYEQIDSLRKAIDGIDDLFINKLETSYYEEDNED